MNNKFKNCLQDIQKVLKKHNMSLCIAEYVEDGFYLVDNQYAKDARVRKYSYISYRKILCLWGIYSDKYSTSLPDKGIIEQ